MCRCLVVVMIVKKSWKENFINFDVIVFLENSVLDCYDGSWFVVYKYFDLVVSIFVFVIVDWVEVDLLFKVDLFVVCENKFWWMDRDFVVVVGDDFCLLMFGLSIEVWLVFFWKV